MKRGKLLVLALLAALLAASVTRAQTIIYVKASAPAGGNGQTWGTAYKDIQSALTTASGIPVGQRNVQVWIAASTYRPTDSLSLPAKTALYGGFTGIESTLQARNSQANVTTISGDVNGNDGAGDSGRSDNLCEILTASSVSDVLLDGLVISHGGLGATGTCPYGVGMYLSSAVVVVRSCVFRDNSTADDGGGVYVLDSTATFSDCLFLSNRSNYSGAGIYTRGSNTSLVRCWLDANSARTNGGAIFVDYTTSDIGAITLVACRLTRNAAMNGGGGGLMVSNSAPGGAATTAVQGCVFVGNTASSTGGAIQRTNGSLAVVNTLVALNSSDGVVGGGINGANSSTSIRNCILWGNVNPSGPINVRRSQLEGTPGTLQYCTIQGWNLTTNGNNALDPLFVDLDGADNIPGTADDNYSVLPGSPLIDSADPTALPLDTFDLDGDGYTAEPTPL